jgi:hypothetical protein
VLLSDEQGQVTVVPPGAVHGKIDWGMFDFEFCNALADIPYALVPRKESFTERKRHWIMGLAVSA